MPSSHAITVFYELYSSNAGSHGKFGLDPGGVGGGRCGWSQAGRIRAALRKTFPNTVPTLIYCQKCITTPTPSSSPPNNSPKLSNRLPRDLRAMDSASASASAPEIVLDGAPLFRVHKGGFVERLMGSPTVSASEDDESVASKDVVLDPRTGVFVRLFLPRPANPETRLPVLLYVHGGAFCIESAASSAYHEYMRRMAREAEVICVSVDYRRVPEHRLPAAYDDCFSALEWLRRQAQAADGAADTWLRCHADFSRCYVAGDSAGANIVHNLGIRAGSAWGGSAGGLGIRGAVLVHPFFAAKERLGDEPPADLEQGLWKACLPEGEDEDYWCFNPAGPRSPSVGGLIYPRILVAVADKDFLRERGLWYYDILRNHSGKRVELLTTENEGHVFHLMDPTSQNAALLMKSIADFIHSPEA